MRLALGRFAALILVDLSIASAACSSVPKPPEGARPDASVITHEQIREHHFPNAFDAVQALHSNWLQVRATDSINFPSEVRVYVDNTSFGGVESLRIIDIASIKTIQFFDGISATARWGIDHGGGVILVSTHH